jgi:hypothetical protein
VADVWSKSIRRNLSLIMHDLLIQAAGKLHSDSHLEDSREKGVSASLLKTSKGGGGGQKLTIMEVRS